MKTKNVLALAALATIGITACSNEEDLQFPDMKNVPITYTAGINDLSSSTRTTDAEILLNRDISLFLETAGTTDSKYSAFNMNLHKGDDGNWTPEHELLWKDNNSEVTYYAYMPHKNNLRYDGTDDPEAYVKVDTEQDSLSMIDNDFCYATVKKTTATENAGVINLKFKHILSKLTVKLETAKPLTDGIKVQELKIAEWRYSTGYQLKSQTLKRNYVETSLTFWKKDDLLFQGLLIPNPYDDHGVVMPHELLIYITTGTDDGQKMKKYKFLSAKPLVFESGKKYEMTLKIRNDNDAGEAEEVTLGSITAEPWESTQEETLVID